MGHFPGTVKLREYSLTALVNTGARPCIHRDHWVSDPTSPIVQGKLFSHQPSIGDVLTHSREVGFSFTRDRGLTAAHWCLHLLLVILTLLHSARYPGSVWRCWDLDTDNKSRAMNERTSGRRLGTSLNTSAGRHYVTCTHIIYTFVTVTILCRWLQYVPATRTVIQWIDSVVCSSSQFVPLCSL